jgi:peptidoglycan biosynthesis protein MviN/MurJ (putative lipid II flippase)
MFRAVRTLMLGGVAGKALGVVRELLTASLFGTGPIAVAYRLAQAAFLIPMNGLLSDALSAGFTPAYARSGMEHTARGRAVFAGMHAVVLTGSMLVALALALLAAPWVRLLAPGFDESTGSLAARMVVVLALGVPLYAAVSVYAAAGIAAGEPWLAAARASWQNACVLGGTLLAWWRGEPIYIAAGFVAAYALLALAGAGMAYRRGLSFWPRRSEWSGALAELAPVGRAVRLLLLVPLLIQLHLVIERRVASIVSPDAVAALDYARFLSETALLLLAMPFGVAGLGALAPLADDRFRELAARSLRTLLYAGVPLSLAAALHAEPIVRFVYERGAFGAESVAATTAVLQWSAPGLWGALVGYAGVRFLSARSANGRATSIYVAAFGANIAVNVALHPFIGAAALGAAAAANGVVFGLAIVGALGLFARLARDLATLAALATSYVALMAVAPGEFAAHAWLPFAAFLCYWIAAASLVPSCRRVVADTWSALRVA